MKRLPVLIMVLLLGTAFAAEVSAPEIGDSLRAKYWRALDGLHTAQAVFQTVLTDMSAVCKGEVYSDGKTGEPTCRAPQATISPATPTPTQ